MGQTYDAITPRLRAFIDAQPMFFVASAPLAGDGHVNLSPKARAGTLRVLDEHTVAYLDFGGSHAETTAHYCARKPHNATSIDGLPALPLPLRPR